MPIYEYKCSNEHIFEVMQRMTDDPVIACEVCGAPVQRVFHPIAVHFKGSGFYNTDYGTKKRAREQKESKDSKSSESKSSSSSDSAKPETKSESKSSSDSSAKPAAKSD